jgi:hypothetical protein
MFEEKILHDVALLQRNLINRYLELNSEAIDNKWLIGIDRKNNFHMGQELWEAAVHGAGLMFTRLQPEPHLVVDMHKKINDPDRLDAWRIQQFIESMGKEIDFQEAEMHLKKLVSQGVLVWSREMDYRICKPL